VHWKRWPVLIAALGLASLVACAGKTTPVEGPATLALPTATVASTPTEPPPTPTEAPTHTPVSLTEEPPEALPPEPMEITFQTTDGQVLHGRYYPAAVSPAPVVVLMHWAPGDREDWNEIAFWLQNRGLAGTSANVGSVPWLDPSWFPPMPEGRSYAVFTFTFRGCDGGCKEFLRDEWQLDAVAALETAMGLEGVDPARVVALGASIGADGAPDGCFMHNDVHAGSCWGALSLSPGSYLNVPYADAVAALGEEEPPKPVWCLYATEDAEAVSACRSASGDHYRAFEWEGQLHGMMLLTPDLDPNPMEVILDWLDVVLGE